MSFFHLNEHVDPPFASALKSQGADATTTIDASLRSASDNEKLEFVRGAKTRHRDQRLYFLRIASQSSDPPATRIFKKPSHPQWGRKSKVWVHR